MQTKLQFHSASGRCLQISHCRWHWTAPIVSSKRIPIAYRTPISRGDNLRLVDLCAEQCADEHGKCLRDRHRQAIRGKGIWNTSSTFVDLVRQPHVSGVGKSRNWLLPSTAECVSAQRNLHQGKKHLEITHLHYTYYEVTLQKQLQLSAENQWRTVITPSVS